MKRMGLIALAAVAALTGCAGAMTPNAAYDWRGPHPSQQWDECREASEGNRAEAARAYDNARGKYRTAGSEAGAAIGAGMIAGPGSIYRCMIAHGYTFEPMDWSDPMKAQWNEDFIRDEKEWAGNEVKNTCWTQYETPAERRLHCAGKD